MTKHDDERSICAVQIVSNVDGDGNTDTVNVTFNETLASEGLSVNSADAEFTDDSDVSIDSSAEIVDGNTVRSRSPQARRVISNSLLMSLRMHPVDNDTDYGINASFVDSGGDNVNSTNIGNLTVVDTDQTANGFLSGRVSDTDNDDINNAGSGKKGG
ncbi:MAG: hypothetical protein U5K28_11935 [Halobacteriales archaeon]|nr:hypothetical protein [Halobacteriales archaeon]